MPTLKSLFCGLALACAGLYAQGQPASAEGIRPLRLTVTAADSRGEPVSDLTADDFRISDDGKPQRVALFRSNGGGLPAPSQGGREAFNRAAPRHITAVLLDFLNENQTDVQEASRKIGASLKQLGSGESLYLYALQMDGKLYPVHAFEKPGETPDPKWVQDAEGMMGKAVKKLAGVRPAVGDEEIVKRTYVGLETLAKELAAFPGRRDIVWVTTNVPSVGDPKKIGCSGTWVDCGLYVQHLSVTLDAAGAVVNPYSYSSLLGPEKTRDMEEMAGLTGGSTYLSQDMGAVAKALSNGAGVYAMVYEPPPTNWDMNFHKVKVTCERKGIKIQARQRYFGLTDSRTPAMREQATLVAAYQSPMDVPDIGLRAALSPGSDPQKTIRVEMRVDPADLLLQEQGGMYEGQLTVLFSARTAAGPKGEPAIANLALHMTKEQRATALKEGIPLAREYPIDNTIQNVRLIVLDHGANSVGSLTMPVAR